VFCATRAWGSGRFCVWIPPVHPWTSACVLITICRKAVDEGALLLPTLLRDVGTVHAQRISVRQTHSLKPANQLGIEAHQPGKTLTGAAINNRL
jgi:hypothetical protein